ncbi:MAG: kelch repeat-containing protein [bacterium]|nr:kelch repeat-containing protein [bacterium]
MSVSRRDMQVYAIMAVSVTAGPLIPVQLDQMTRNSSLVISVVEAGFPIPGSQIEVLSEDGQSKGKFISSDKGYAIELKGPKGTGPHEILLPSGNYQIKVKKEGFQLENSKVFLAENDFVEKIIPLEASNHRPVPNPGETQYTNPGRPLKLDASASHDPDADPEDPTKGIQGFSWELSQRPSGSKTPSISTEAKSFVFRPDVKGTYAFNLSVFDGQLAQSMEHQVEVGTPYDEGAPIPIHIAGHRVVRIKDKAYLIGGWNGSYSNRVFAYDLERNSWNELAPMKVARNHFAAVSVNGAIYVFGGHNQEQRDGLSSVEVYNPAANRWDTAPKLPTPRYNLTAEVVGGKIYVMGGLGGPQRLEIFDPQTETWSRGEDLHTPRYRHTSASIEGKIYLIGGHTTESLLEVYDPATDHWEESPPMPTGRYYLDAVAMGGKIYVIGGHGTGAGAGEPAVEVFDPKSQTWSRKNSLPFALDTHASIVFNDRIYTFGGEKEFGTSKTIDNTFVYDPRFDIRD